MKLKLTDEEIQNMPSDEFVELLKKTQAGEVEIEYDREIPIVRGTLGGDAVVYFNAPSRKAQPEE